MMKKMRFVPWKRRLYRLPVRHFFGNRNVKDRLFCYIFEHDRKSLLKLYNALNGTDYQDEQALQIVTLDNVVYMSMNNDVAFILGASLNLYEHQSTLCPNLPLRFLIYLAAEFESLVGRMNGNIYGSSLIRLPAPRCIVFYNGNDAIGEEQILQLTDAFTDENGKKQDSCLNLTVRVLNINHGYNAELMAGCRRLEEYSLFVAKLKEFQRCNLSLDEVIDSTMAYCIDHGILDDILLPFQMEVKKMLLTEYDEKKTMKAFQKEAYANGMSEGYKQGEAERQKLAQELQEMQRQMAELQKQNEEIRLFKDALREKGMTLAELSQTVQQWPTKKEA